MSMKQSVKGIARTCAVLMFLSMSTFAATGIQFLMLEEPMDARATAMGSAGTALDGMGFSYYNPAALYFCRESFISIEFGRQGGDVRRGVIETAWVFPRWFAGGNFSTFGSQFTGADERGTKPLLPLSYQNTFGTLAAGFSKDRFAIGLGVNGVQERIAEADAFGMSFSAGIAFSALPDKLNLGIAGFHQGMSKGFREETSQWADGGIPRSLRAGASWHDTMGHSTDYTAALDIVYRDIDGRFMVPFGIELWPLPALALRAGKRLFHDTELFNAGAGLRWGSFRYDAAFVGSRLVRDIEMKWIMRCTYSLSTAVKKPLTAAVQAKPVKDEAADAPIDAPASAPAVDTTVTVPSQPPIPDTTGISEPGNAISGSEESSVQENSVVPASLPLPADSLQVPRTADDPPEQNIVPDSPPSDSAAPKVN